MFVLRRVRADDLDKIEELASSYTLGVVSLPKDRLKLEYKLKLALTSFDKFVEKPNYELYLFLLEDTETNQACGISGIMARAGADEPNHFFRRETLRQEKGIELPQIEVLQPISYQYGPSEICSLFLKPSFRRDGLGKLLSLARFLFIASNPHRFSETIIAELRGYFDDHNVSPFWESVGRKFLNMSYQGAMALRDKGLFHYYDLIPEFPIYVSMLTKSAQKCIGRVHPHTKPALKMLTAEGFKKRNEIDIFDGGPVIESKTLEVRSVRTSKEAIVGKIRNEFKKHHNCIVATIGMDFRACFSDVDELTHDKIAISEETAKALKIDIGSKVRYVHIRK